MSNYIVSNDTVRIIPDAAINMAQKLPIGTYTVEIVPQSGELYLKKTEDFERPKCVYGEAERQSERLIDTFEAREHNTGVMLSGEKGSGKTFLAKYISWKLLKKNYATIMINAQYDTVALSTLIHNISEPCLVIFDEFEKIYNKNNDDDNKDPQTGLLTLLDGLLITKKMFVFTCNEPDKVSYMLKNRPGRIFYSLDFGGLSEETIRSYCHKNLKNQDHLEQVINIKKLFGKFTFDMLQALVEEVNRYDESPLEAVKMMNIVPEKMGEYYSVKVIDIAKKFEWCNHLTEQEDNLYCNIFAEKVGRISIWKKNDKDNKKTIAIGVKDLVEQTENGAVYIIGGKYKIILTEENANPFGGRNMYRFAEAAL